MIESTQLVINDILEHVQIISETVAKISTLADSAIVKQNNASFERRVYLFEQKNLEAIIELEERLSGHVAFLQSIVGSSTECEIEQRRANTRKERRGN